MKINFPTLSGVKPTRKHLIYVSCDTAYYYQHVVHLIKSIVNSIDWLGVHVHLVCYEVPTDLYQHSNVSFSYELIDKEFIDSMELDQTIEILAQTRRMLKFQDDYRMKEIIYYSCARFIRMAELFNQDQFVLQVDADTILFNPFPIEEFEEVTKTPRGMRKPKDLDTLIASCIGLGVGQAGEDFRKEFEVELSKEFDKGAYWYMDQVILRKIFQKIDFETIDIRWCSWALKRHDYFSTGKGDLKNSEIYQERVAKWKD